MQRRTLLACLATASLSAPARAAAGFVRTRDQQRLAYLDRGAGPPVVLVHGWSLGSAIWSLQTDWLATRGLRVVAYDKRGHAGSDKPTEGYDFDTLAADLATLLDQLDLTEVTLAAIPWVPAIAPSRHGSRRGAPFSWHRPPRSRPSTMPTASSAPSTTGSWPRSADRPLSCQRAELLQPAEPELVDGYGVALQASPTALVKCLAGLQRDRLPRRHARLHHADAGHPWHGRRPAPPHYRVPPQRLPAAGEPREGAARCS